MDSDTELAVHGVRQSNFKKKINATTWNEDYEKIIAEWGEKASGLRFMHNISADYWRSISDKLTMCSIVTTTIASGASLIAGGIESKEVKDSVLFGVGVVGLITSFLQSVKKFYNCDEKAADHYSISKQFGSYYRYITLQMSMSREDRQCSEELFDWSLKEYERLQQEALPLSKKVVETYNTKFKDSKQASPDICRGEYKIKIYNRNNNVEEGVDLQLN